MGLDAVELIMAYEDAFGVQFTDEDAARMRTPGDVIDFVASRREQVWSRDEIARTVKQITLAQLGDVPYGEDQKFVEDLGVD